MRDIEELGNEIEAAWRDADYRTEAFASIAQTALEQRALPAVAWTDRIFRWFLSSPQVPHQPPHLAFGEPPIQLYAGRRFYIEALFWTDGTTSIHRHSFSGAFQVLLGGSIHTTYSFTQSEQIDGNFALGTLTADRSELLRPGDIRRIESGGRFVHSLFHLERPSLTLVVRTRHDSGTSPQYSYLHPGIAYDPLVHDERMSRLLRLLDILDDQRPETHDLLAEIAATSDFGSVVTMLMRWFCIHPVTPERCEPLLAIIARRHRALADSLRLALQEGRRQALIIQRRRKHHRAEHRFFLALLLNVGDRAQIMRFVQQQFPHADPIELIMTWIKELVAAPARGDTSEQASPEYDLGEAEFEILHHLLRQRTPEQILVDLNEEYDDVERLCPDILDLCASLTSSALFQPLFRTSP